MKVDKLCKKCQKSCKQLHPAIVVSCAKFIPVMVNTEQKTPIEAVAR